jgi:hypothetical protein
VRSRGRVARVATTFVRFREACACAVAVAWKYRTGNAKSAPHMLGVRGHASRVLLWHHLQPADGYVHARAPAPRDRLTTLLPPAEPHCRALPRAHVLGRMPAPFTRFREACACAVAVAWKYRTGNAKSAPHMLGVRGYDSCALPWHHVQRC